MNPTLDRVLAAAKAHCDDVILPQVDRWNQQRNWPRSASDQAAASGLLGLYCPEDLGGQGLSLEHGIRVYEELGRGDGAYAFALSMHNICAYAVCGFATDALKHKWAADLACGRKLANFALTEPQSGSDPATMHTLAQPMPEGCYRITGAKAWVSLAGEADVYLVVAKTDPKPGHQDMAMFAVPKDSKGLSFGTLYDTPSYRFLPMAEMYLDQVEVPAENVILPAGKGFSGALMAINIARVSIAAGCCGLMRSVLDTALRYSRDRRMFGTTSLKKDGIQWALGEVAMEHRMAQLLYRQAAADLGSEEGPLMAAYAKLFAPDAALRAANTCTQVLGGMGLLAPYQLDRASRLAQMLKIVDGTSEIQRLVIGRTLQQYAAKLPPIAIPDQPNQLKTSS